MREERNEVYGGIRIGRGNRPIFNLIKRDSTSNDVAQP
jgi:hypothetical protein